MHVHGSVLAHGFFMAAFAPQPFLQFEEENNIWHSYSILAGWRLTGSLKS